MARIAAISDDLSSDFLDAANLASNLGLDGLAVRHVDGLNVRDLTPDAVASVKRIAGERGLPIAALSSPFGRDLFLNDDDRPAQELLDRMIRYADILDTPLIRAFALWQPGKDSLSEWWERPVSQGLPEQVIERMSRYAARAEQAGVRLMVELEGASYVGQVAEAKRLFDAVSSPALVLCWDVCNGWWSGERPWEEGWPIAQFLPIADVQAKDVCVSVGDPEKPSLEQVVLGSGDLPYEKIVSALLNDGYDGWFTAERVYHPRKPEREPPLRADILSDIANLRRLVAP
ncbi:sugar phosphate isomerase/epimerase family protein [Arthrobacter sp. NA-172]|uniref:sugar phosphate isomerase/epimerase family protein n=1 Tax=Arthrobacter sp. NA-172 TaxID=3367524 RepID=UPI003754E443